MLFWKLLTATRPATAASASAPALTEPDYPLEVEAHLTQLHARAPVRRHLDMLVGDLVLGDESFTDLYFRCLEDTGTVVTPFNVFQRFQTRRDIVRYLLHTREVPGARIECGAYRGATALLMCRALRALDAAFDGADFFLLDSYSGTPASTAPDYIPIRERGGKGRMEPFFPTARSDVDAEAVRTRFREFPRAQVVQGWIPEVLAQLPATPWAFVHIDLTLYEPTLAALEYFHARLSAGGVIVCDGSVFCPGAQKALDAFAAKHDVPYVMLGHREAVFLKP